MSTRKRFEEAHRRISTISGSGNKYTARSAVDELALGTAHYRGHAWFWNYAYRHYLRVRDCSVACRRKVHNAFLKAGLDLDGESPEHEAIVEKFAKSDSRWKNVTGGY